MAKMNRRDMLKLFTSGALGAMVLDPEKLLWVPGEKTIFLPPVIAQAEEELIASMWQLTLRLDDLREASALRTAFVGKEAEMLKMQARLKHGALGTLLLDGEKAFKAEWREVRRGGETVTYETSK